MRKEGVAHGQALLTQDLEKSPAMQEGHLEHSLGHTGTLTLRGTGSLCAAGEVYEEVGGC